MTIMVLRCVSLDTKLQLVPKLQRLNASLHKNYTCHFHFHFSHPPTYFPPKIYKLYQPKKPKNFKKFSIDEAQIRSSPTANPSTFSKKQVLFITSLIVLWYSSNVGVLLLNKFLLSNYGFRFPIFLTMCHMSACAILSYLSIVFFKAVGATAPFFTAVFAYLMTLKREAWFTYAALVPVVAGAVIASGGEPGFHLYGFIVCISATAARAFKSVLQGILLSSEGEKLNSMNLLLHMSPIAALVLLPAALVMEPNVLEVILSLGRQHKYMWLLLILNSTMAYSTNLSNFLVTKHTSALTLQVLGNAKGAVAVVSSIFIFRNPVTLAGIAGYTMSVAGVAAYGEAKRRLR
ncbi:UDP-URONIC ACID TRANSPORTER 1-like isoform X2 [Hevea brasiliensis]|uniref:UDP-URONIC ACID TRANSPORTER 1-like isoform X2 n=1 Tax=Hevea brasiliensis TaxID=3981 RepID=UPI0025F31C62|nr:UDP-URONIC ACID TRANSPORTER 1-like isoform X2 [Hevea brasiliensis]